MDLLLVRHALPKRVELAEGPADPPLSDVGHTQARQVARWLADTAEGGVDAVYTSPLRRAVETAAPLAAALGLAAVEVDDVAEYDRNASAYVPIEELKATNDPRWLAMVEGGYFADAEETAEEFQGRIVGTIDGLVGRHRSERIAIVCHGGVINAYVGHVLGITEFMVFEPGYTSITRIRASSQGHRQLLSLNETGHLRT